ncbi:MAG: glycosyltransferase family 2 protein [Halothiobacillaceae bacterium]
MTSKAQYRLSLVIPMYNEQDNVLPMLERLHEVLGNYFMPWEVLLVNDGSSDGTLAMMWEGRAKYGEHVRVVDLRRNFGQTAAMQAGIDLARGDVIATLDGDLQNDPVDIPRMVNRLLEEDLDLVAGWRKNRQDAIIMRKIPSLIANALIRRMTRVQLHDYGCSLKVFRAEVVKSIRLYGEMHRFIPAWIATYTASNRIAEEVVQHHPRTRGVSKYGISRTFRVIIDLLVVYFFMRFSARPGHFFGMVGLGLGSMGGLIMAYMALLKILGEDIGTRPLFFTGILLILVGVQMLTTGVVAEMLSRVYFESQERKSYIVRNKDVLTVRDDEGWCEPSSP